MKSKPLVLILLSLQWLLAVAAQAEPEEGARRLQVVEPYIDIHTGPGGHYPVTQVAGRGEWLVVLKQRTDWFQVETEKGVRGWVTRAQLERTVTASGAQARFRQVTEEDYRNHVWELGFSGGDFEGADLLAAYLGLAFNRNLSAELSLAQALGEYSNSYLVDLSLVSQPFPRWRYSPYLSIGIGTVTTKPQTILIQAEDETAATALVGLGLRAYLTRQFMVKIEYRNYILFNSDEDNEEVDQWTAGFAAFF